MTAGGEPFTLRLRPGVAATVLRAGLHLRGRDGSVTLEGSKALPALWELLADRLGAEPAAPAGTARRPGGLDPSDPRVASALDGLAGQLRAHGLLAELPEGGEGPAAWLAASTDRPGAAAAALAAAPPVVTAADPGAPLAAALLRALHRAGARPEARTDSRLPPGLVVAAAGAPPVAVAADRTAGGGFVTAPTAPERVRADAGAVAARLGGTVSASAAAAGADALTALLAGAAAQRLLCAAAGLPDPAGADEDQRLLPGRPAVLVAEAAPPRASYHPWAAGPAAASEPALPPAADLAEALRRVGALADPLLGVLDAPLPGRLPQLPAALAACRTPAGPLVAGAPRADLARLTAACRAAELRLGGAAVVGAGPGHARGRALRRAALAASGRADTGPALPEEEWREHPQARHWWAVLTGIAGHAQARLAVRQLGGEQAYAAVVRVPGAPAPLGRAVEATPADAAAVALLGAVTRAMAADHGPAGAAHAPFSGAEAPLAAAGTEPAAWADEGWTDVWLTGTAHREAALTAALTRLTGPAPGPWLPPGGDPVAARTATVLRSCGFTVLADPKESP
ncbi:hypothetical protein C0216_17015 [Streptomyces globosus]|uniref:Uncharacterized protein n=1 Tax=Streptomyces globosus TaxID=68209 RepID=A0A344U203_9ACTN|nr:hypothetical protein [Streptomyces globosus]AXE24924.1 hypothetical protein C0216_17015 [Streptomyces globosus]